MLLFPIHSDSQLFANYAEGVVSMRALLIRDRLLEKHKEEPFLTEEEVSGMEKFIGSSSWSGKFMRQSGMRLVALHGEAGDVDIEAASPRVA